MARFYVGGVATRSIRYVLPVLWMTSCFLIMTLRPVLCIPNRRQRATITTAEILIRFCSAMAMLTSERADFGRNLHAPKYALLLSFFNAEKSVGGQVKKSITSESHFTWQLDVEHYRKLTCKISQLKFQTVAEKTAKNFRGLLYFAPPCICVPCLMLARVVFLWQRGHTDTQVIKPPTTLRTHSCSNGC